LQGRVVVRSGSSARVALDGGLDLIIPTPPDAGDKVLVALRPEAITLRALGANDMPAPNSALATVEQAIFHGLLTRVYLRLDTGETLQVLLQAQAQAQGQEGPSVALSPGSRVLARWSEVDNHVVVDR
jgi:ABC-type Fe3+/spermidine/putrescine transport system ATPase subunit